MGRRHLSRQTRLDGPPPWMMTQHHRITACLMGRYGSGPAEMPVEGSRSLITSGPTLAGAGRALQSSISIGFAASRLVPSAGRTRGRREKAGFVPGVALRRAYKAGGLQFAQLISRASEETGNLLVVCCPVHHLTFNCCLDTHLGSLAAAGRPGTARVPGPLPPKLPAWCPWPEMPALLPS